MHGGCSWALGAAGTTLPFSERWSLAWCSKAGRQKASLSVLGRYRTSFNLCRCWFYFYAFPSFLFLWEMALPCVNMPYYWICFFDRVTWLLLEFIHVPKYLLKSCVIFPSCLPFFKYSVSVLLGCGVFPQTEQISTSALETQVMVLPVAQHPAQLQATERKNAMGNDAWLH